MVVDIIKVKVPFENRIGYFVKQIVQKPSWLMMFFFGRLIVVRRIYKLIYQSIPSSNRSAIRKSSLFSQLDSQKAINSLKKDGIFSSISLPENIVREILHFVYSNQCYGGGINNMGFKINEKEELDAAYGKSFFVARYFNVSNSCSAVKKLIKDPKIWQIASAYIGKQAKYTGASLYWTFPVEHPSHDSTNQLAFCQYHYDLDDFASVRFSFYLTDVDLDSGPHFCILGSHCKRAFGHEVNFLSRRQPEKQLKNFYGEDKIISLVGRSGSGFIEDTFCFHRGSVPKTTRRLFLQLHFAANNYNFTEHHDYRPIEELKAFNFEINLNQEH